MRTSLHPSWQGVLRPRRRTILIDHRDPRPALLKPPGKMTPAGRRRSVIGSRPPRMSHRRWSRTWEPEVSKTRRWTDTCGSPVIAEARSPDAYQHSADAVLVKAAEAVADATASLLGDEAPKGAVVPL